MFKDNLREMMELRRVSITELDRRTGIGRPAIYNYLRNKNANPKLSCLQKVSKALDCTVAWLLK